MSLKDIFKQQSKGMESLATTGTIGMHMVSGPLVGFAIGYGLDAWLETGPWLKLVFLVIGIIAGFMNVYEDTQRLLRKMSREEEQKRAEALADRPERVTVKKKTVVPDSIARAYAPEGQGKYDWVRQDQIDWYLETEAALAARNGGTPIPAYAFQHIIVPDIYDAMDIVPSSEKKNGAVEGYGCRKGTYYSAASVIEAGTLGEAPCPPDVNGGEFAAWKQGGDIVAGFFGHDHVNDFIIPYEGIDLVNTNGTGFYIYGAGELHGARLVTLHEADPTAYETQMLYYKDLIGTKLPFGFAGTWGAYVQGIVLLAVGALVLVGAGVTVLVVRLVKKSRNKRKAT